MKKFLSNFFLILAIISPFLCLGYLVHTNNLQDNVVQQKQISILQEGSELPFVACEVFDGYKFGIVFDNEEWIIGHLPIATKSESVEKVQEMLKSSKGVPSVKLLRQIDDYWIVDIYLNGPDKISLLELLRKENLLLAK